MCGFFFYIFQITSISRKFDCSESTDNSVQVRCYTFEYDMRWVFMATCFFFPTLSDQSLLHYI